MTIRHRFPQADSYTTAPLLTRRQALGGAAALAATYCLPAHVIPAGRPDATNSSPSGANLQPTPSGGATAVALTITETTAGAIVPGFAGLSYEKAQISRHNHLFTGSNSNLIALFKLLGPSVLRVGGNSADQSTWAPNGPGQIVGQIAPTDVDALAAFVKATGWQCIYGINLGGAGPKPYANGHHFATTTPELAAAEVAYAASKLGSSLAGIEIGNECGLFGSSYFRGVTWDLPTFEALWEKFRAAIVAQTPGVKVTGPVGGADVDSWVVPFGQWATKKRLSVLTEHYYRGTGMTPDTSPENLLEPDPIVPVGLAGLRSGARSIGIPYRIGECNSYSHPSAKTRGICDAYCSALWAVDLLFQCASYEAAGVDFHAGWSDPGEFTPIADSGGAVVEVRPEYYGLLFFTLAGQGTLHSTSLSGAGNMNVAAYAVRTSSGGINIVVMNKNSAHNLRLAVQLPQRIKSATLLELTQLSLGAKGPNLSATSGVTIQDATVGTNGSFSPSAPYSLNACGMQLNCYVPNLSAVLIRTS